jgi:hypothetical protein
MELARYPVGIGDPNESVMVRVTCGNPQCTFSHHEWFEVLPGMSAPVIV